MTPKEKAKKLIDKYTFQYESVTDENYGYITQMLSAKLAKKCALIAVDEILEALEEYDKRTENYLKEDFPDYFSFELQNMDSEFRFWEQVKKEIEKL